MSADCFSWDTRIAFVVRYMYDIDNNGFLDQKDFDCMALRATIIEGRGDCNASKLAEFQHIMRSLWEELSDLADFDKVCIRFKLSLKDGMITTDEFKEAVRKTCVGKKYGEFPQAMKAFIEANFKMMDLDNDGLIGVQEFRYNCIQRLAIDNIQVVDDAFYSLLNDNDKIKGGLTLERYQDLYGEFLGNTEKNPGCYLFGPLGIEE
ncbi:CLUMA_CG007481, isoform A [Clunio marinus]|uniref:CLUMA_CG007481, isoform A n=1 Tax=Clunio marinus TaxID=568069 RepID=A0A1J1I2G3_9DIPT|nr:CLUMA_CG007481, isoform A [Clunio marinus]